MRLRKEARDEIDRLMRFLDETDNHMELDGNWTARLKRMAPSLAIARKYRGLHTGWETVRSTVQKAAQCRAFAKRQHPRDF